MTDIASELQTILTEFVQARDLGLVIGSHKATFTLSQGDKPEATLTASIAFVQRARVPPVGSPERRGPWRFPPDLAVEISSPKQTKEAMRAKTRQWLVGGVRLVWVVWPQPRQIEIWQPLPGLWTPTVLNIGDRLDGMEVLPEFSLPLGDLFLL